MKNNPFITIFLLICVEILLYNIIDYFELLNASNKYASLIYYFLIFSIPIICILISLFFKDILFKKELRRFSIFLIIITIIVLIGVLYFGAVAKSFQH